MQIFPALDIGLRDVVNFSLFENTTIGTTFSRVRLIGVVDYSTAVQKIDPVALHEDIITNLPEGSIDVGSSILPSGKLVMISSCSATGSIFWTAVL